MDASKRGLWHFSTIMGMTWCPRRTRTSTTSSLYDLFETIARCCVPQKVASLDQAQESDSPPGYHAGADRDELWAGTSHRLQPCFGRSYRGCCGALPGVPTAASAAAVRSCNDQQPVDHGADRHSQRLPRQPPVRTRPRTGPFPDPLGGHWLEQFHHRARAGRVVSHAETDSCTLSPGGFSP